jgi:hypothetical protein
MKTAKKDPVPLTGAELDQLEALNRARTPGPVDVLRWPGDGNGYAVCEVDSYIVRSHCTEREPAEVDARAIAAALNALPALLAEVRVSRAVAAHHVRAQDAEGRYLRGWVVATDPSGRVMLDIAMETGERSGHVSGWLTAPERCAVYVRAPSPFEPRLNNTSEDQ